MDLASWNETERLGLADLFSELSDEQLGTPSLCSEWTVRDVLAHLATPYLRPPSKVVLEALRRRGFGAAMAAVAAEVSNEPLERQIEALRASATDPFVPPMVGIGAPLTDAVMHGEDIRVPLGIEHDIPAAHARAVLEFGTSWRASPIFLPYRRLDGIRFVATDADWSHGSGLLVQGSAQQVLRAMFGRSAAAEGLTGDGVDVLASRFAA
jgi:uncharacterized protein (TIGR03083 family)